MVEFITTFNGRTFIEQNNYITLERYPAGITNNHGYCITVEKSLELPYQRGNQSGDRRPQKKKKVVRIVRWKARINKEQQDAKEWRKISAYNVRSSNEWENSASFVNSLMGVDLTDTTFIKIPIEDHDKLLKNERRIDQLESEIKKLRSEERALQIESATFRKRVELMKKNKQKYDDILLNFNELIENPNSTESHVHRFIKKFKPYWFFGLEYVDMNSNVKFPPQTKEYEFDIMLKRYDNYYDLVELKGPNERLFSQVTSHRKKPLRKLSESLGQVFTYLHVCEKDTTMMNLLKPSAFVVIGKEQSDDLKERRIMSSFLSNVEIITYSDLVQRGKKLFEYIDTL